MNTDAHVMYENYVDGITKRQGELAGNVMDIVKHGMPSRAEFIKIRHELHRKVKEIQDRGTAATEQEKQEGHRMMGQIRAYRSQHPNDPGAYADDADGTATVAATPEVSLQPHGALADVTDVQIKSMNMLQNHGFYVSRVSNAHAEQMGGPVAYMGRNNGAMHQMAAVDPQGMINDESPAEYVKNHVHAEEAETSAKQSYNAMTHLTQAANQIRDILLEHADDEAQVEHVIRMAQIILGPKSDHTDAEYRKMLDGLIVILNRFIIVPMN